MKPINRKEISKPIVNQKSRSSSIIYLPLLSYSLSERFNLVECTEPGA